MVGEEAGRLHGHEVKCGEKIERWVLHRGCVTGDRWGNRATASRVAFDFRRPLAASRGSDDEA